MLESIQPPALARTPPYARVVARASTQVMLGMSEESRQWIAALRGPAEARDRALSELHALLLRAARFELGRRRGQLDRVGPGEVEDLAVQAADDALMAILGKLDSFRERAASPPGRTSSRCSRRA